MGISSTSGSLYKSKINSLDQKIIADPELRIQPEESQHDDSAHSALLYTQALRAAQNAPDVRAEKVAMLKERIASGLYEIDAKAIALALVKDECEIGSLYS